jgi:hypothetical protein
MKKYWDNLKTHPGTEVCALITIAMISAIASRTDNLPIIKCIELGLLSVSPFWIVVLVTNYTNNK